MKFSKGENRSRRTSRVFWYFTRTFVVAVTSFFFSRDDWSRSPSFFQSPRSCRSSSNIWSRAGWRGRTLLPASRSRPRSRMTSQIWRSRTRRSRRRWWPGARSPWAPLWTASRHFRTAPRRRRARRKPGPRVRTRRDIATTVSGVRCASPSPTRRCRPAGAPASATILPDAPVSALSVSRSATGSTWMLSGTSLLTANNLSLMDGSQFFLSDRQADSRSYSHLQLYTYVIIINNIYIIIYS